MRDFCPYCSCEGRDLFVSSQPYRDQPDVTRSFFTCSSCGTIYPSPRLDFAEIHHYIIGMERKIPTDLSPNYHIPWYDYTSRILTRLKNTFKIHAALDIGANNGKFCLQLEKAGISATGIEPQETLVNLAKKHRLNVLLGVYPEAIPDSITGSIYDMVSMNEVIYYFPDLKKTLAAVYNSLSDNGILYIQSYLGDNDMRRYNSTLFARPGDYLQALPTIKTIRFWLENSGFEIIEIIPVPDEYFNILTGIPSEKCRLVQRVLNMIIGKFTRTSQFWIDKVDRVIIISRKSSHHDI